MNSVQFYKLLHLDAACGGKDVWCMRCVAVLMVWFFSSMDPRYLCDFVFTMYDTDNDGLLSKVG